VINGRKWFTSGAMNEDCKILIVMGKTDPDNPRPHHQQSMILVPRDTPGVRIMRDMQAFGYDTRPAATPKSSTTTCGCPPPTSSWARVAASRSRRADSGRDASTTACA
jgi:hypothetical protein